MKSPSFYMRAIDKYLQKLTPSIIQKKPHPSTELIVTIPAFNESETIKSLESLLACSTDNFNVEILVGVNYSELASENEKFFNQTSFSILEHFASAHSQLSIDIIPVFLPDQPIKKAGVGWARKLLMDEAFRRFLSLGKEDGIITGFDADTLCDVNYLNAIYSFFNLETQAKACSIRFEHEMEGEKYPLEYYKAVVLYELHLRYYIEGLKYTGTPFAFQTVGSSFAVKAKYYAQVNGMTPHKAGEDFYFLQKMMDLGGFYQLNTTCLHPSSRISNRVGFGTGPSVSQISEEGVKWTFNWKTFVMIQQFFGTVPDFYKGISPSGVQFPIEFVNYLLSINADNVVAKMRIQHKSEQAFKKAFMQWFNGFQILKVLNLMKQTQGYEDVNVVESVQKIGIEEAFNNPVEALKKLREKDSRVPYYTV
ncbi:MAG: glycosyltransferase family 2 protein [Bacteroidales bacterium]|nr:glycosyltransferase family 2 protein [Bacteroidales bacterium]